MKKTRLLPSVHSPRPVAPRFLAGIIGLAGIALLPAAAPPAATSIRFTGADSEGRSTYRLEWDAESNLVYRVQSRAGLEADAPWTTYDLVRATGARASFQAVTEQGVPPETGARGRFHDVAVSYVPIIFGAARNVLSRSRPPFL